MEVIEIQPLYEVDEGPIMGFYARGHYKRIDFLRVMLEYVAEEGYEDKLFYAKRGPGFYPWLRVWDVHWLWWRAVPWQGGEGMELQVAEPHSRGAFAVTSWEMR